MNKTQKIASIVKALQTQGEQLTDEELQQIQLKTDPLLATADGIDIDQGDTHIHPPPH
jgi:hypothetical protein